jgi:hypothetical protein
MIDLGILNKELVEEFGIQLVHCGTQVPERSACNQVNLALDWHGKVTMNPSGKIAN